MMTGNNRNDATAGKIVVGSNLIIKESRLDGQSGIAATEIGGNLVIVRNEAADANAALGALVKRSIMGTLPLEIEVTMSARAVLEAAPVSRTR